MTLLFVAVFAFLVCVFGDHPPPFFTIDMNQPANVRWAETCNRMGVEAAKVVDFFQTVLPSNISAAFEKVADDYYKILGEPYKSETDYFALCMNRTVNEIIMTNLIYDLVVGCTSILALSPDGKILHGRNQDFPLDFKNDTCNFVFTWNGQETFRAVSFFAYLGIPTGQKPNKFTITIDGRHNESLIDNIANIDKKYFPSGWLARDVLTNCSTYDDALQVLTTEKIQTSIYYIIGGVTEGAVVTRSADKTWDVWNLSVSNYADDNWYILETNYDHWTPAPTTDDRRDAGIKWMNETGADNIDPVTLFDVLAIPPVYNVWTLYTIIMSAANPEMWDATIKDRVPPFINETTFQHTFNSFTLLSNKTWVLT